MVGSFGLLTGSKPVASQGCLCLVNGSSRSGPRSLAYDEGELSRMLRHCPLSEQVKSCNNARAHPEDQHSDGDMYATWV